MATANYGFTKTPSYFKVEDSHGGHSVRDYRIDKR